MKLIVLTKPYFFKGEADILNSLFSNGLTHLHLRKPETSQKKIIALMEKIQADFHSKITVHYFPESADYFDILGLHISEKQTPMDIQNSREISIELKQSKTFYLSQSFHNPQVLLKKLPGLDYILLSPVFNSISKTGYQGKIVPKEMSRIIKNKYKPSPKVYALGGVTEKNIPEARDMGFDGVAILGSIWEEYEKPGQVLKNFENYNRIIQNTHVNN